jgi:hypothetical protein
MKQNRVFHSFGELLPVFKFDAAKEARQHDRKTQRAKKRKGPSPKGRPVGQGNCSQP